MTQTVRPRNADTTRAALMVAARRRFTMLGYAGTTTRDIAADAGVNVALISRYFGSKDGLMAAVLDDSSAMLDLASNDDPVDSFIDGLRPGAHPTYGDEHPLRLLLRDSGDDQHAARLRTQALETAVEVVQRHQTSSSGPAGRVSGAADPQSRLRADLVLALLAGTVMLREAMPREPIGSHDLDRLHRELARAVAAILS